MYGVLPSPMKLMNGHSGHQIKHGLMVTAMAATEWYSAGLDKLTLLHDEFFNGKIR